jgi:hypothetical protein
MKTQGVSSEESEFVANAFRRGWRGGAREHPAYRGITTAAEELAPALDQATNQSWANPLGGSE